MNLMPAVRGWLSAAGDLVWPASCAACGNHTGIDEPELCPVCAAEMARLVAPEYCRHCGAMPGPHLLRDSECAQCQNNGGRFANFLQVGRYRGPLKSMILRFKRDRSLDAPLGRLLGTAIVGRFDPSQIDVWVPIPSHWRRRLLRGFHPAHLLARQAAACFGGRVAPLLRMTRNVQPFHQGVSATERVQRIRGAFAVRSPAAVRGRHIALIDDVTTTGATLAEARRVLRKAGARLVSAAVLAKAGAGIEHEDAPLRIPPPERVHALLAAAGFDRESRRVRATPSAAPSSGSRPSTVQRAR